MNQIEDCVESEIDSKVGILNSPFEVEVVAKRKESPLKLMRAEYAAPVDEVEAFDPDAQVPEEAVDQSLFFRPIQGQIEKKRY